MHFGEVCGWVRDRLVFSIVTAWASWLGHLRDCWKHRVRLLVVVSVSICQTKRLLLHLEGVLLWHEPIVRHHHLLLLLLHHHLLKRTIVALVHWLVHTVWCEVSACPCGSLTSLIRSAHDPTNALRERVLHHIHRLPHLHLHLLVLDWLGRSSPVGEQGFVDLQQGAFIVHEQIQDVALVLRCEVRHFHSVLG